MTDFSLLTHCSSAFVCNKGSLLAMLLKLDDLSLSSQQEEEKKNHEAYNPTLKCLILWLIDSISFALLVNPWS